MVCAWLSLRLKVAQKDEDKQVVVVQYDDLQTSSDRVCNSLKTSGRCAGIITKPSCDERHI